MCSSGIVNYISNQFEPVWDAEDISEEHRAEPVQARLLIVCLFFLVNTLDTLLFVSATASVSL